MAILTPPVARSGWQPDRIVAMWQADTERLGRPPTRPEFLARPDAPAEATLRRHFGTFENLARAAGTEFVRMSPGPRRDDVIPNDLLREAFLRSSVSLSDVARELGWYRTRSRKGKRRRRYWQGADSTRVARVLGISPQQSHGITYTQRTIGEDTAERIARAVGADPHEVGL